MRKIHAAHHCLLNSYLLYKPLPIFDFVYDTGSNANDRAAIIAITCAICVPMVHVSDKCL